MAKEKDDNKKLEDAAAAKAEKREPKVRTKPVKLPTYEWAVNTIKLKLATEHVDTIRPGISAQERHDAIKQRYLELKGPLRGDKRYKDGMHEIGTPRPTSEQAIAYDEGKEIGSVDTDDDDEEDDEDMDELVEDTL